MSAEEPISRDVLAQYEAARGACALAEFVDWSILRFSGPECGKFLQGLMTSDVLALTGGQSGPSCLLTTKGRIRAHVILCRKGDEILAVGPKKALDNMVEDLGRVIMLSQARMDRAEDLAAPFLLLGPKTPEVLSRIASLDATLIRDPRLDRDGTLLIIPKESRDAAVATIESAGKATGLSQLGAQALEILRLEAGVPAFGAELGENVFPQEAGLENAVSLSKGCYLGQEIMSRLTRVGHVNRLLKRIKIAGKKIPAADVKVFCQGRESGLITSAIWSPREGAVLALVFIKREDAERGSRLEVADPQPLPAEII